MRKRALLAVFWGGVPPCWTTGGADHPHTCPSPLYRTCARPFRKASRPALDSPNGGVADQKAHRNSCTFWTSQTGKGAGIFFDPKIPKHAVFFGFISLNKISPPQKKKQRLNLFSPRRSAGGIDFFQMGGIPGTPWSIWCFVLCLAK